MRSERGARLNIYKITDNITTKASRVVSLARPIVNVIKVPVPSSFHNCMRNAGCGWTLISAHAVLQARRNINKFGINLRLVELWNRGEKSIFPSSSHVRHNSRLKRNLLAKPQRKRRRNVFEALAIARVPTVLEVVQWKMIGSRMEPVAIVRVI